MFTQHGSNPLRLFVTGEGGTGKSRVINAVMHLADKLSARSYFRLSAYTGVAAHLIKGETIHKLFGIGINKRKKSAHKSAVNERLRHVRFIIIDEISMVSPELLVELHTRLCDLHASDLPFGGVNVIVFGDFMQLRPVGANSLYDCTDIQANGTNSCPKAHEINRTNVWSLFQLVVRLLHQVRAADDSNLRQICKEARNHHVSNSTAALLKSRLISNIPNAQSLLANDPKWINAPILTTRTAICATLNALKLRRFAKVTNTMTFVFAAKDMLGEHEIQNYSMQQQMLRDHLGNKTSKKNQNAEKRAAPVLEVCVGARIVLRQNLAVSLGLCNGTTGTVVKIELDDKCETHFVINRPNTCFVTGGNPIIYFKPDDMESPLSRYQFNDCDHGVYPLTRCKHDGFNVFCTKTTCTELNIPLTSSSSETRKLHVNRYQFPFELAYAMTDFKCQGRSYDFGIIDLLRPSVGDSNSPYVLVSRFKRLDGLMILRDFNVASTFNHPISQALKSQLDKEANLNLCTL